MLLVFFDSLSR